jgi:hypothetical protein
VSRRGIRRVGGAGGSGGCGWCGLPSRVGGRADVRQSTAVRAPIWVIYRVPGWGNPMPSRPGLCGSATSQAGCAPFYPSTHARLASSYGEGL